MCDRKPDEERMGDIGERVMLEVENAEILEDK